MSRERPIEPGSPENLYEVFAMRLVGEGSETKSRNLKILRDALILKIEDDASTPGTRDIVSEKYSDIVEKLRRGEKISCGGRYGFHVSAIGHEFQLSEEDKIILREHICEEGDFIKKGR